MSDKTDVVKGRLKDTVFGILIVEDILAIIMIALLSGIAMTGSLNFGEVVATTTRLGIFMAVALPAMHKQARITNELRKSKLPPVSDDDQTIPPETAEAIVAAVKARFPALPIIWGGNFGSLYPEPVLNAPYVDWLVRGQGEHAFAELLEAIRARLRRDVTI